MGLLLRLLLALAASLALPAWASSQPAPLSSSAPETASGVSAASVAEGHTYFVGEAQALVHNTCEPLRIALGVDASQGWTLERFARHTQSRSWRTWPADLTTGKAFPEAFDGAIARAKSIKFKLDDLTPWTSRVGRQGLGIQNQVTRAELEIITSNPDLIRKTRFYLDGRRLSNDEAFAALARLLPQ